MVRRAALLLGSIGVCCALVGPAGVWAQPTGGQAKPAVQAPAQVKLRDAVVFELTRERRQLSARERAKAASQALEHALLAPAGPVRVVSQDEGRAIFAAGVPIVVVYAEDAASSGQESLDVYAAHIATRLREALEAERRRSDIAQVVFSISLVVFFGLIVLYVLKRIADLTERARDHVQRHPERIASVRVSSVEVIGGGSLRAALLVGLIVGRWLLSIAVVYGWLVLSLSRFELTRPYTVRLTGSLFTPFASLAERVLSSLPVLLLALIFAVCVYVMVRFVELFFAGVQRGEARAPWLPRDLVEPTGVLIRIAIAILAVILAGPVVTGDPNSALARAGQVLLLALALAATPLLASLALGAVAIYSRRLGVGAWMEVGSARGRVVSVGLIDVHLRDERGADVRVPHLSTLLRPSRVELEDPRLTVTLSVDAQSSLEQVRDLLEAAAHAFGHSVVVELLEIDVDGASYRVSVVSGKAQRASDLRLALSQALIRAGVRWGRARSGSASS